MGMKRKFEGIQELSPGVFRIRAELKDPTTLDPRTGKPKTFEIDRKLRGVTAKEAFERLEELKEAAAHGGRLPSKQTFATYAKSWYKVTIARLGELSRRNYFQFLAHHCLPKWGDRVIDSITPMEVKEWVADLEDTEVQGRRWKDAAGVWQAPRPTGKKLRPATVTSILTCFRMVMTSAQMDLHLPFNPALGVRGPKARKAPRDEINSLVPLDSNDSNREELLQKFLELTLKHKPDFYAQIVLGFDLGARDAETRPLRWIVDYNETTRVLVLQRSQRGQSLREEDEGTKNGRDRDVILDERVHEILMWHKERQMRSGRPNPMGLMFPPKLESKSGFQSASTMNGVFRHIEKLMDLSYRITPKAKRRTMNSMCAAKNMPGEMIRRVTGHLDPAMTELYTAQPRSNTLIVQRAALGNVIPMPRKEGANGERADDGAERSGKPGKRVPAEAKE